MKPRVRSDRKHWEDDSGVWAAKAEWRSRGLSEDAARPARKKVWGAWLALLAAASVIATLLFCVAEAA